MNDSHPTKILTNDSHPTKILKRNINVNRGFGFSAYVAVGWVDVKRTNKDQLFNLNQKFWILILQKHKQNINLTIKVDSQPGVLDSPPTWLWVGSMRRRRVSTKQT